VRTSAAPRDRFERFIWEPARALMTIGPIIIVIDAVDESGDKSARRLTAEALPVNFRVLHTPLCF